MNKPLDVRLLDLNEIRRRAQARIDWDGGCALPSEVPPEVIVALVDEITNLREKLAESAAIASMNRISRSKERHGPEATTKNCSYCSDPACKGQCTKGWT